MAFSNDRKALMSRTKVHLDVDKLLVTVKSFLECLELSETVSCLEKEANLPPFEYPSEISLIRVFINDGDWKTLIDYLQILSKAGRVEELVFSVKKQQFLEALCCQENCGTPSTPFDPSSVENQLKHLQQLCPSPSEYEFLQHLASLPSLHHHPDFVTWDKNDARSKLFRYIGRQVASVIYADQVDAFFPSSNDSCLSKNRLVVLASKGQMYEQCETAVKRELACDIADGYVDLQRCISSKLIKSSCQELASFPVKVSVEGRSQPRSTLVDAGVNASGLFTSQAPRFANMPPSGIMSHVSNIDRGHEATSTPSVDNPSPQVEAVQGKFLTTTVSQSTKAYSVGLSSPHHPVVEDDLKISEIEISPVHPAPNVTTIVERAMGTSTIARPQHVGTPGAQELRQVIVSKPDIEPDPNRGIHSHPSSPVQSGQTLTCDGYQAMLQNGEGMSEGVSCDDTPTTSGTPSESDSSTQLMDGEDKEGGCSDVDRSSTSSPLPVSEPISHPELNNRATTDHPNDTIPPSSRPPLEPGLRQKTIIRSTSSLPDGFNTPDIPEMVPDVAIDSSTPKPPRSRTTGHHGLPPTSPVPYVVGTHGLSDTPHREAVQIRRGLSPLLAEFRTQNQQEQPTLNLMQDSCADVKLEPESAEDSNQVPIPRLEFIGCVKDKQVVRSVAFDPNGHLVAIGANSKCLRICSAEAISSRQPHQSSIDIPVLYNHSSYHHGSIYCLSWNSNSLLASGSNDQMIRLLCVDREEGVALSTPTDLHIHSCTVRDLLFLNNNLLTSAGSADSLVKVTDCSNGMAVTEFKGHTSQILSLSSYAPSTILSSGQEGLVNVWDTATRDPVNSIPLPSPAGSLAVQGDNLAVGCLDGSVSLYDRRMIGPTSPLHTCRLHSDECRSVRFSPDGRFLLTGSYDRTLHMVDASDLTSETVATHKDKVIQARWHPSGLSCCSCSVDKSACFWKVIF